jgi:hypothetical protein
VVVVRISHLIERQIGRTVRLALGPGNAPLKKIPSACAAPPVRRMECHAIHPSKVAIVIMPLRSAWHIGDLLAASHSSLRMNGATSWKRGGWTDENPA